MRRRAAFPLRRMYNMNIILASASPRRRELLELAGVEFTVHTSDAEETVPVGLTPSETARLLARQKAEAVASVCHDECVIGADTIVVSDGRILGKPHSTGEAAEMLALLSGKTHSVITGVCVICNGKANSFFEETAVKFHTLTPEEINAYVQTGEPMDKAGAYGIQGKGGALVEDIDGDYFNVVGLPVARLMTELQKLGIVKQPQLKIKNIVFDMGGVIIDFDPMKLLKAHFDEADIPAAREVLFESGIWRDMDRGTATEEATAAIACSRLPERLHKGVRELFTNLCEQMPPVDKMPELIAELKQKGFGVYLLSNAPIQFYEKREKIPVLSIFDGLAFSSMYQLIKPEPEMYYTFFKEFSLKPEECFFIDDMQRNVDAARAVGMDGHCYENHDIRKLREVLKLKCPVLPQN